MSNSTTSYIEVPLTRGMVAIIDAEDSYILDVKWYAHKRQRGGFDALRTDHKKPRAMHRLIMGVPDNLEVDHKDNNPLNNTRDNLRIASRSQNCRNRKININSTSGYKGVTYHAQCKKWQAAIGHARQNFYLGLFDDPADAARAYDAKARELWGEFARLNFPERDNQP